MRWREWARDAAGEALGRQRRADPVVPGSGGPAGNARLTAWLGAILLVLFLVELVTLLDVRGLLSWHIAVGVLLVPPALIKTATTSWRIAGYYLRRPAYHQAGPPPMVLRVLGPLVVLTTLAVLGSGLALVALGPDASRTAFATLLGFRIDALTVHQATFAAWAVVTGLHTLGRLVPAFRILTHRPARPGARLPGGVKRGSVLVATLAAAGLAAGLLLGPAAPWLSDSQLHFHHARGIEHTDRH
ncbi:hypothetical protein [Amycolatopsis alkalitolerans]|uniref:Uncharacterized protein n=1 Tax=Amycolatopsis alkalitolerans TaxID=2547244 RepID=A0A5C4LZX7_9PSEU|nr:hypothetical protein [Amycolatopsis alkalitolerans]TNC25721.1 hypothetical protein FG385_13800 [Amycolatopsis alkalitolerans]